MSRGWTIQPESCGSIQTRGDTKAQFRSLRPKKPKKMTFRTATYAPGGSVLDAGCVLQNLTLAMGIEWG